MKTTGLVLILWLAAASAGAHAGHNEFGVFEPPHGGAFAKMGEFYAEVYLADGKLYFCLEWPSGEPADNEYIPTNLVLRVTPKGGKAVTLSRETAGDDACAGWAFTTKAKWVRVDIKAVIDDVPMKTRVTWEAGE